LFDSRAPFLSLKLTKTQISISVLSCWLEGVVSIWKPSLVHFESMESAEIHSTKASLWFFMVFRQIATFCSSSVLDLNYWSNRCTRVKKSLQDDCLVRIWIETRLEFLNYFYLINFICNLDHKDLPKKRKKCSNISTKVSILRSFL